MAPVVLVHGIFGYSRLGWGPLTLRYFVGIEQAIEKRGHAVLTPRLHPWGSIDQRARQLRQAVLEFLRGRNVAGGRVIILAHSMGGLDARYMISRLAMADRVAALVTISTPHHGSPLADFFHEHRLMRRLGWPFLRLIGLEFDAVVHLTRQRAAQFNREVPDAPQVRYFSVSCACPSQKIPLAMLASYGLIWKEEGDNDGQVSVKSSLWGERLGIWPVHHLHAINHRFPRDLLEKESNIAPRYLELLDELGKRGIS